MPKKFRRYLPDNLRRFRLLNILYLSLFSSTYQSSFEPLIITPPAKRTYSLLITAFADRRVVPSHIFRHREVFFKRLTPFTFFSPAFKCIAFKEFLDFHVCRNFFLGYVRFLTFNVKIFRSGNSFSFKWYYEIIYTSVFRRFVKCFSQQSFHIIWKNF